MKSIIKVNNISKTFGKKKALKNISFDVDCGEIIGIVGHNGAGKTTLINCIVDIYKQDKGSIEYLFDKKALQDHIGVQMQHSHFENKAKVMDICKLYKDITGSDEDINELLKDFDLYKERKTYIKHLSGGNKQRLAVLLALIHHPDVIFLDELTTGLDPVARRVTWNILKKINKNKDITIILTSHYLDEIEYLANRILILNEGEMAYLGTVTDAIDKYSHGEKIIEFQLKDSNGKFKLFKYNPKELPDGRYQIQTDDDESVLKYLLEHVGIKNLAVKSPSLEDVFLEVAGYKLDEKGDIINEKSESIRSI